MSGSESGPSGGLWDTLTANSSTITSFVTNPESFILGIVIPALVSMLILTPLRYGIGFIEWAGAIVTDVFGIVERQVMASLAPVRVAIVGSESSNGVIDTVYGSVEAGLMDAGLGAPFAATLTVVVFATALTVLIYALIRIGADAVPGVGGLIR